MESILPLLEQTQKASAAVRNLSGQQRSDLLLSLADKVLANVANIIAENKKDLDVMDDADPKKDRLLLNEQRIQGLAQSLRDVAALPDPSGQVILERTIEQGLSLRKIAVPLGVVGVIYESRPNVTLDVASLCLRSGNACVLKGGKEAHFSNLFLVGLIHKTLAEFDINSEAVMLLPTDRKFVTELLTATKFVDIIIPRGSESLIKFVRENSLVPTIETGAGVCHTYVEKTGDLEKAAAIVVNAKVSRPSVCNSLDTILLDKEIASELLPKLKADFIKWNVEVFADETSYAILEKDGYPMLQHAEEKDFGREFLDYKCSVKVVDGLDEALDHIRAHSSRHSEAIISKDEGKIERFLREVDAAAVYANASTRFTDGAVFALGAEIGISTQKLHARGPFALEKLVTEKWIVKGDGQVRW
ncbi:glutamate-5-semialdehyde dehydrogenase [Dyadobacter chenwenxiniae]|uniref:Gamma-glutamyl phosphate reductase n=1 Tax=Dyadobacter chenwenxiniae TaxID=2906456 RepID=A0A9X1PN47_9BACT|nr:glutamate-5-semialdehyde dehydrogenase [Dyadobacter chenwenxiniae]MCF0061521.1 glutamate-5-semialdehyde dehydrogenase [Dyadobacter chenwenxiniae]UON81344.1 glutamate-5-semialdehyde dehydrogenase [Dyadobacter chenwenxiniae]